MTQQDPFTLPARDLARFVQRMKASSALPREPDIAQLFRQILQKACELVPSESGAILLDEPLSKAMPTAERRLHFVAAFGPAAEKVMGESIPADSGVAGHVYCTGEAYLAADAGEDAAFADSTDRQTGYRTRSIIAAPIVIGESVCGTVELVNRLSGERFDAHDLVLLEVFASYTASSIQNALDARQAQELARMDDLTGLYNDRYLHLRLREELERAAAAERPCALLFMDLDRFKPVNDRYGHLVGSQVLREIAFVLRAATAGLEVILARYGGDEFAIVLPGLDATAARSVAVDVRRAVEEAVFLERDRGPGMPALRLQGEVSASIGVAAIEPGDPPVRDPALWLIRAADEAMYSEKKEGRDPASVR
jgi:diguanylate cyclase (GGDEF)-like protein